MHLFLYGESGAGKTYCMERALREQRITPAGFMTRKVRGKSESRLLGRDLASGREELLGLWRDGAMTLFPERFDALGETALRGVAPGDVVRMDELGRFEQNAPGFQAAVLRTLHTPCRVIGAIKDEDLPFLRAVRETPCVQAIPISEHTRAETYRIVRDFLRPRSLCEALGVGIGMTAVVGGGGKTTLLHALARELSAEDKVILSTTTHISVPEDMPYTAEEKELRRLLQTRNLVCAGRLFEPGRLEPCAPPEALMHLCDHLLLEADGSKHLPAKAHAPHEPVIPSGARVIGVLGADAFGQPIRTAAHRPELYAAALGVDEDTIITGELAARACARADVMLINKVETAERLTQARAFARCRGKRQKTVLASLFRARPVIEIWEGDLCVW